MTGAISTYSTFFKTIIFMQHGFDFNQISGEGLVLNISLLIGNS